MLAEKGYVNHAHGLLRRAFSLSAQDESNLLEVCSYDLHPVYSVERATEHIDP